MQKKFFADTAENLETDILLVLSEFEIPIHLIYCITTDNAANLLKAVKILNDKISVKDESDDEDCSFSNLNANEEIVEAEDWAEKLCSNLPKAFIKKRHRWTPVCCSYHSIKRH